MNNQNVNNDNSHFTGTERKLQNREPADTPCNKWICYATLSLTKKAQNALTSAGRSLTRIGCKHRTIDCIRNHWHHRRIDRGAKNCVLFATDAY